MIQERLSALMPAQRLTNEPVRVERLDVVGEDSGSVPNFVCHLGLAIETQARLSRGEQVAVRDGGGHPPRAIQAHRQRCHVP
jgi:hypothetical protein